MAPLKKGKDPLTLAIVLGGSAAANAEHAIKEGIFSIKDGRKLSEGLKTSVIEKIDPRQANGSIYGMVPAHRGYDRQIGEWNLMEVTVKGPRITVELNGTRINQGDVSEVKEFLGGKPHPGKDLAKGYFGFAGHGDAVSFRKIAIKKL